MEKDRPKQDKLEDAAWHLKDELGDDVGRDIPIEWCREVLVEVLGILGVLGSVEGRVDISSDQERPQNPV